MDNPNAFEKSPARYPRRRNGILKTLGVMITAIGFFAMSALPAWAAEIMTVTFIRHGQSDGNLSGFIDTSTPGPSITALGQQQADAVASKMSYNNYDAIYASTMVRTQQTAVPMSKALGLPVTVLNGIQEIEAGSFEGTPEASAGSGYGMIPLLWSVGLPQYGMPQDKSKVMPGTTLDGYGFDARVDNALQTMYDNGDRNAVVFSHGGAIMFWTLMNATNLDTAGKLKLIQSGGLGNTGVVVVQGNNEDGWKLVSWNGQQISAAPTFAETVALQSRTLSRQLAAAAAQVRDAFATGNIGKVLTAITTSASTAAFSVQKYVRAVATATAQQVGVTVANIQANINTAVNQIKTNLTNALGGKTGTSAASSVAAAAATDAPKVSAVSAAAQVSTSSAKTGDAPAIAGKSDAKKAAAEAKKAEAKAKADAKKADAAAKKAEAKATADANKADAKNAAAKTGSSVKAAA